MPNYAIIIPIEDRAVKQELKARAIRTNQNLAASKINGLEFVQHDKLHITLFELKRDLTQGQIQHIRTILTTNPPPELALSLANNQGLGDERTRKYTPHIGVMIVSPELQLYYAQINTQIQQYVFQQHKNMVDDYGYNPHVSYGQVRAKQNEVADYDPQVNISKLIEDNIAGNEDVEFPLHRIELNSRTYRHGKNTEESVFHVGTKLSGDERVPVKTSYTRLWQNYTKISNAQSKQPQAYPQPDESKCDDDNLVLAKAVLAVVAEDYLAPKSAGFLQCAWAQRVVSGHWNRHYLDWAEQILEEHGVSEDEDYSTEKLQALYQNLVTERGRILTNEMGRNKNNPQKSSHLRRLNFAIAKLEDSPAITELMGDVATFTMK